MAENITLKNFSVTFQTSHGEVKAVREVNTVFESGKVTGMIGESGSGKSVLGMGILKLLAANARLSGQCFYGEEEISAYSEKQMTAFRGLKVGLIPQNPAESLDPVIRIKKQLIEAVTTHDSSGRKAAEKRYDFLMKRFGFDEPEVIGRKYSFQLSGGMNQRIISVLGLMCSPGWMLADEPTKGLDAILRKQVCETLREVLENDTRSMIIITHDVILARRLCDNILVLYQGEVLEQGSAELVLGKPLHPYTEGLIASLPSNGMVPIPLPLAERSGRSGCVFYPRCLYGTERCGKERPCDYTAPDGRKVRCFRHASS